MSVLLNLLCSSFQFRFDGIETERKIISILLNLVNPYTEQTFSQSMMTTVIKWAVNQWLLEVHN